MTEPHFDLGPRQMRAVAALARYGSFVAAASHLGISQPALTRTIKQVEAALGVALFTRTTRQVGLTPAGEEFVPLAERMIAELDLIVRNMRDLAGQQRGQLAVACLMSVAHSILPGIVGDYRSRHPRIALQIRENVHAAIIEDVRSGIVDFGISEVSHPTEGLAMEELWVEPFLVVVPRGHPFAGLAQITLDRLRDTDLVTVPPGAGMRRIIDGIAAAAGLSLTYAITVNQFATIYDLVARGIGVAVVPASAVPDAFGARDLVSIPLAEPRALRRVGLVRRQDRPPSPAAGGLIELLRSAATAWSHASRSRR